MRGEGRPLASDMIFSHRNQLGFLDSRFADLAVFGLLFKQLHQIAVSNSQRSCEIFKPEFSFVSVFSVLFPGHVEFFSQNNGDSILKMAR